MDCAPTVRRKVVLLSSAHSVSGELALHNERLSDLLNDPRSSEVVLHDAAVTRLLAPARPLAQHPTAVVTKSHIVLAFEFEDKDAPATRRFFSYVAKSTFPVFMILHGMEVRGSLHTLGNLDLRALVASHDLRFLAVTNAAVSLIANERYLIRQNAVLVNALQIRYIAAASPETPEEPPAPAAATG